MASQGTFGYIIGKKKRFSYVQHDADLLWQILIREIYVLIKHYKTKEELQEAFSKIKVVKGNPKKSDIEKCKIFTDFEKTPNDWNCILRYCQSSFINTLESGYILTQEQDYGYVFILDFNKGIARYYNKDHRNIISEIQSATLKEIETFDDMPAKTYIEIVTEMKTSFDKYYEKYIYIQKEIDKVNSILEDAKRQGAGNIEDKAQRMLDILKWDHKKLNMERRVFYHRLKALDLIEEEK